MIHHPLSPYKGERYPYPVELVDVYPTLNHLLRAPYDKAKVCKDQKCEPLSGKSLARVVLGNEIFNYNFPSEMVSRGDRNSTNKLTVTSRMLQKKDRKKDRKMKLRINRLKSAELDTAVKTTNSTMPILDQRFAISQSLRCAEKKWLAYAEQNLTRANILEKLRRAPLWNDCDITKHDADIVSLLGYAMRTPEYRYIAYFYFDLKYFRVDLTREPYAEELYDHHFEKASSFTHQETVNVITRPKYRQDADQLLQSLKDFIKTIDFHNQTLNFFPK